MDLVLRCRILSIILRILVGLLAALQMSLFACVALSQKPSDRMGSHRPVTDTIGCLILQTVVMSTVFPTWKRALNHSPSLLWKNGVPAGCGVQLLMPARMITLALTAPASAAYFGSPYQENTGMLYIKPWLKEVVAFKQFEACKKSSQSHVHHCRTSLIDEDR